MPIPISIDDDSSDESVNDPHADAIAVLELLDERLMGAKGMKGLSLLIRLTVPHAFGATIVIDGFVKICLCVSMSNTIVAKVEYDEKCIDYDDHSLVDFLPKIDRDSLNCIWRLACARNTCCSADRAVLDNITSLLQYECKLIVTQEI